MIRTGQAVGPRSLALLVLAGVTGIALAMHGWSGRHHGLPPSLAVPAASRTQAAHGSPDPGGQAAPRTSPPTQGPVAPSATPSPSASPAGGPGPKLSSQQYASYAFQVWPGPVTAAAKAAETGLVIIVHRQAGGLLVTAGVTGQAKGAPKFYAGGAKVYVIEATMGDDSGNSDFNLGDDALVVTDAQGRILQ